MPSSDPLVREIDTPLGAARITVHPARAARAADVHGTVVLGHGAGGGIESADLQAVTAAACAAGWRVVLVEQPWRVAGRKVAAPPPRLDVAWLVVVRALGLGTTALDAAPAGELLVLGGRSAGARVACRTAAELGADGVLALAFPLHPPGRPERSRADELAQAAVATLVVQGRRDAFGTPDEIVAAVPGVQVHPVDGDHALKADPDGAARAAVSWLGELSRRAGRPPAR
ncbi:MAG: alpha/beta family hydrolase [Kineosporiaceae bacterium]